MSEGRTLGGRTAQWLAATPARALVSSLAYAAPLPYLLSRHGADVVGAWSLLVTALAAVSAYDGGLTGVLRRDATRAARSGVLEEVVFDLRVGHRAILAVTAAATLVTAGVVAVAGTGSEMVEPYLYPVAVATAGFVVQSSMATAVLAAFRADGTLHLVAAATAVARAVVAVLLAAADLPLLGAVVGFTVAARVELWWAGRILRRLEGYDLAAAKVVAWPVTRGDARRLFARSRGSGSSHVADLAREPAFRAGAALALGLGKLAALAIAFAAARIVRDLVGVWSWTLSTALSDLHAAARGAPLRRAFRYVFVSFTLVGGVAGLCVAFTASTVVRWWVPDAPPQTADVLALVGAVVFVDVAGLPCWAALRAAGSARWVSAAALVAIPLCLVPLSWWSSSPEAWALAWLGSTVVLQLGLAWRASRELPELRAVWRHGDVIVALAAMTAATVAAQLAVGVEDAPPAVALATLGLAGIGLAALVREHWTYRHPHPEPEEEAGDVIELRSAPNRPRDGATGPAAAPPAGAAPRGRPGPP